MAFCGPSPGAWGKNAPALTVSQLRLLLAVILPIRTYTVPEALALVAWVQQWHPRASLSQRKRRNMAGEIPQSRSWRLLTNGVSFISSNKRRSLTGSHRGVQVEVVARFQQRGAPYDSPRFHYRTVLRRGRGDA